MCRSYAGVLQFNTKRMQSFVLEHCYGLKNELVSSMESKRIKKNLRNIQRKADNPGYRRPCYYQRGRTGYGEGMESENLPVEEYDRLQQELVRKIESIHDNREAIQRDTLTQGRSQTWLDVRKVLLTASNFGSIIKSRSIASYGGKVKSILYSSPHSDAIINGSITEEEAKNFYEEKNQIIIQPCGIFIDDDIKFLGATPDGLIDQDGIVEIKCPYINLAKQRKSSTTTLHQSNIPESVFHAVRDKIGRLHTYLEITGNTLGLKQNTDYYRQIQGQLHITKRSYCIFFVYLKINGVYTDSFEQKIIRNDSIWKNDMVKKLVDFYMGYLLPEIIEKNGMNAIKPHNNDWCLNEINRKLFSENYLQNLDNEGN